MNAKGNINNTGMIIWVKPNGAEDFKLFHNWADATEYERLYNLQKKLNALKPIMNWEDAIEYERLYNLQTNNTTITYDDAYVEAGGSQ